MLNRKITYRMYPGSTQLACLETYLGLHQRLYNTALEERIRVYGETGQSLSFPAQCKELTGWRKQCASLKAINAQSLQVTLKRLSLAYASFFRRVKNGEVAGFPRFKPLQRFSGWGYKTYGDGWKLFQESGQNGRVRLTGIGEIRLRGKGRFTGSPKTAEVIHKSGKWYLSVSYEVTAEALARQQGTEAGAFDWGIMTLLTVACADGTMESIENPRWLKTRLEAIKGLQRIVSEEEIKAKALLGLTPEEPLKKGQRLPVNARLKRLYAQVRALHGKIARQRHDFYHQLTAVLVSRFAFLGTEALAVKGMTKKPKAKADPNKPGEFLPNGAQKKANLNRGILDAAPMMLPGMLTTKAEEAGSWFAKANTRTLKPTQRCHGCGSLVKKALEERTHRCSCGVTCDRDENAARTLLRWVFEGESWPGTGQAGSMVSCLTLPETPPIAVALHSA